MLGTILALVGVLWRLSFISDYATGRIKKFVSCRHFLTGILALVCSLPYSAMAAQVREATVSAAPGTLVRWHGARIDPRFLFEDPAKIPAVNP